MLAGVVRRGSARILLVVLMLAAAACGADDAGGGGDGGGAYPEQSIRWIVAFDPGGGSDTEFRRLQPHLEEALGVSIEVEYRPGAGGGVGWTELVNAKPDGYTVGGIVMPHIVLQPLLQEDSGFQTDQFAFVTANVQAPQALVVSADSPAYEDFEALAADLEANPGGVDVGASARFNLSHLIATALGESGLEMNYVPTGEGATAVLAGVAGGHFPVGMLGANHAVGSEEVRAIAVSSEERFEALPDVPTFTELGFDVTGATSWGVAAPPETPLEVRQTLADAIIDALENPEVQESMASEGQEALALGPDETKQFVGDIAGRYAEIIETLKAQQ